MDPSCHTQACVELFSEAKTSVKPVFHQAHMGRARTLKPALRHSRLTLFELCIHQLKSSARPFLVCHQTEPQACSMRIEHAEYARSHTKMVFVEPVTALAISIPCPHKPRQCPANWMCWHVAMLIYRSSTDRLTWKLQVKRTICATGRGHHILHSNAMTCQFHTTACILVTISAVTAVADSLCMPAAAQTGFVPVVTCPTYASVQLYATLENLVRLPLPGCWLCS